MKRIMYKGGQNVGAGSYWNISGGDLVRMETAGRLPEDAETTFVRAHPVVMLAAGPILGLVYAAFLPFIGLAIVAKLAVTKLLGGSLQGLTKVATFNWSPSAAYFAGRRHKGKASDDAKGDNKSPGSAETK